eukprot:TRINITY_DN21700_c0_g1_i1.p1 TRINITY_DN21700_c0_g1~~TRINITY_DN21700_c0_g1_i1.p1  ORF type:complete len:410 (+),score=20.54 TRINITY_DN21700_c0_g1_i1:74-1303(+)
MGNTIFRLRSVVTLFHKGRIVDNFRSVWKRGIGYRIAHRGQRVATFLSNEQATLPAHFTYEGKEVLTTDFLRDTSTTGIVVISVPNPKQRPTEAKLLYEQYFLGNTEESKCCSWSVGKSVVGALLGIALKQGKINSLDDKVSDYLPELRKSGYGSVTLRNLLQMSSGIRFTEDTGRFFSDVSRMGRMIALGYSINGFAASLKRECEQGVALHYNSMNTQVLAAVIDRALGPDCSLTEYLEETIWTKVGFEDDAYWLLDNDKNEMELAFGTLSARTRDYARLGWLYLNEGKSPLDGSQVIDEDWIVQSVTPDCEHLQPGLHEKYNRWGYGYHIWVLGEDADPTKIAGDYVFSGVYGQFVYISPQDRIVIARNSAYADFTTDKDKAAFMRKAVASFRAMAKHFKRSHAWEP